LGLDGTVSGTSTDSEFTARLLQASLTELAGAAREDLLPFAVGVELEVFHTLIADDCTPSSASTAATDLNVRPTGTTRRGPR
jgi:hypothetical protein